VGSLPEAQGGKKKGAITARRGQRCDSQCEQNWPAFRGQKPRFLPAGRKQPLGALAESRRRLSAHKNNPSRTGVLAGKSRAFCPQIETAARLAAESAAGDFQPIN
jgi:hypothetical protein